MRNVVVCACGKKEVCHDKCETSTEKRSNEIEKEEEKKKEVKREDTKKISDGQLPHTKKMLLNTIIMMLCKPK